MASGRTPLANFNPPTFQEPAATDLLKPKPKRTAAFQRSSELGDEYCEKGEKRQVLSYMFWGGVLPRV